MTNRTRLLTLIACGMAGGLCSVAHAQAPYLVNISGATLQRNFFIAPASTNDFCDVDHDGAPTPDQLGPAGTGLTVPGQFWQVQYRGTGSGNGLAELVAWGTTYAIGADGVDISSGAAAEGAWHNRTQYWGPGVTGPFNGLNPGGAPNRSLKDGSYRVTLSNDDNIAGIQIDIAPLDVTLEWFVVVPGTPGQKLTPTTPGYGMNPRIAVNKDGTPTAQGNMLESLGGLNQNYGAPDNLTAYSTRIAVAPVAALTNYGTGRQQITYTELKWLNSTGRLPSGENLMMITRDSGSGTRNAWCNSLCMDPSWGVGENVGGFAGSSSMDVLGPNWQPSNKGGSSRMDATVINHRLAIGYTGAERGAGSGGFLTTHKIEVLAVKNDLAGGTVFARPTANNVLDNDVNGYNIWGPSSWVTIGDPLASGPADCGDSNGNPTMRNGHAAAFVNNTTKAVAAFKALPGGDDTVFSPGEYLASQYILTNAVDFTRDFTSPCTLIPNPNLNQALQDFTRTNSVLASPIYAAFDNTGAGLVPTRTTGPTYSDNVVGGASYRDQAGANVAYGSSLSLRNKIAGDFNNDGLRNWNDIPAMVAAWRDRNGGPAWQPGTNAIIEVLGDFNGDGNFGRKFNTMTSMFEPDTSDVRYFADGLALDPVSGKLNRLEGFTRVDAAFGGNFFGTVLATGVAYQNGDSAADVAGPNGLVARGFAPIGADKRVDAYDIDYICANFGDWSDQSDSVVIDLSCDVNGDCVVDAADVTYVVRTILRTRFGDVNLDGMVTAADRMIVQANLGTNGGWAQGDMNCDGVINAADLAIVNGALCPADLTGDGQVGAADLAQLLGSWGACP